MSRSDLPTYNPLVKVLGLIVAVGSRDPSTPALFMASALVLLPFADAGCR
ncbi:hypothetical protein [Nocardia sp. CNY236]|nr:hypothetical protein [Nocardia sp. CNY236]